MALQEVGVEAVVKGLSAFQNDIGKINQSLQGLRGEGTLLERAFGSITEGLLNFGSHIVNIAENALGFLLRDAIRAVVDSIKEMVSATIEAGNEFQVLELRLERLNFNDLIESGDSYSAAGEKAVEITKEQLAWLQKLAATTPYDSEDVANTYTLARSYGFSADEAQNLTEKILDFAAGMGLGNTEIKRIIVNFGQMVQQGKVTQRELTDLARGAFVPVNDILGVMAENLTKSGAAVQDFSADIAEQQEKLKGLQEDLQVALLKQEEFTDTTKESTKAANQFRIDELRRKIGETEALISDFQSKTGKAVEVTVDNYKDLQEAGLLAGNEVDAFFTAFSDLVETKFSGASEKMSRTFKSSVDNVKDLVKGIFGLNTVKPVLDVLGERVAAFANAFTADPKTWDRLVAVATRLGTALSDVVSGILGLLPGTGDIADKVIELVDKAAQWVEDNRENIIGFFAGIGDSIRNDVVPWIRDNLIPAIQEFIAWVGEHKDEILGFFKELGQTIIEDVVPFVRDYLIPFFRKFSDWVLENKDLILSLFNQLGDAVLQLADIFLPKLQEAMQWITDNPEKIQTIIDLWAKWQVVGTILSIAGGIILSVGGFILGLFSAVSGLIGIINGLIAVISSPLMLVLGAAVGQFYFVKFMIEQVTQSVEYWKEKISEGIAIFKSNLQQMGDAIRNRDWGALGRSIIEGIANGLKWAAGTLIQAAKDAAMNAYNAVKNALGIHSPSTLFFNIGAETMQGLALGIQKSAGLAASTMQSAMAQMTASAVPSVTNSTVYNNTSNYNLTVNSAGQNESIVQDYSMMQSLAGV